MLEITGTHACMHEGAMDGWLPAWLGGVALYVHASIETCAVLYTHPHPPPPMIGENVAFSYISCPADPGQALGIKLPFLVLVLKNVSARFYSLSLRCVGIPMPLCDVCVYWCMYVCVFPFLMLALKNVSANLPFLGAGVCVYFCV